MKSLLRIYGSICRDGVLKQSKITYPNIKSHFLANNFKHQQIRWKRVVRVNPLQAIKERKAPKPVREDIILSNGNARLVDDSGKNYGILSPNDILSLAKKEKKGVFQVATDPIVYKLMPIQKKEKQEKLKLKEVRISDVITEHDLQIKVERIKKFLIDQYKVQVILSFKQTKDADPTVAHLLMTNIISRLSDYSEIDFAEKLSKDKKSVCMLNPLPPEKYEAMGIKTEKVAPVKREKKKTLSEEELMEKRRKKEEKLQRLRQLWEQNNNDDVFISANEKYKEVLEKYGETARTIERKKELLEAGLTYPEVEKIIKKEERERKRLEELKRKENQEEEDEEEEEDLDEIIRKFYKPSQRARMDVSDYNKYDDEYEENYDMDDDMYIPEFDEEFIEDEDHMYR